MSLPPDLPPYDKALDDSGWRKHWHTLGQNWRTQPEISTDRQKYLNKFHSPRIANQHIHFPFKDERFSRADIEWLLATHESFQRHGPVNIIDDFQIERTGINLIGANLANLDLNGLPLARMNESFSSQKIIKDKGASPTINFENTNLTDAHLEEADLRRANLKNANLTSAHLTGIQLSDAHLEDAFFNEANLEQADLTDSQIVRGHFIKAHLERAILRDACLDDACFNETHMESIDAKGTSIGGTTFLKAHLESADFRKAVGGAKQANFHLAFLEYAKFQEANLQGANFHGAHLEGADLQGAHLEDADLRNAHLEGANLREVHLEGADLRGAHLNGKKMTPSDLERIRKWSSQPQFPDTLSPADLRGAFFSSGTKLYSVVLGNTDYGFTPLADISWGEVNLNLIDWEQVDMIGDENRARINQKNLARPSGQPRAHSLTKEQTLQNLQKRKANLLEDYKAAVRANRHLAHKLQDQGLNEIAARFSYKAQLLHRIVLRMEGKRLQYYSSLLLDLISGYGYKPVRSFIAYITVLLFFMTLYRLLEPSLTWNIAFVLSVTCLGRGLLPVSANGVVTNLIANIAVLEAFISLVIEATFIATLTQRFFGK